MSTHSRAPRRVALIPGDGIGPEVSEATVRLPGATGVPVACQRVEAGAGLDRFTDAVIDPLE